MGEISISHRVTSAKKRSSILSRLIARRYLVFVILVAPAFLLRLITAAYPIYQTILLSFTNVDLIGGTNDYVGLKNYSKIMSDYGVQGALSFTITFVIGSTVLELIVGMMIAQLLNAKFRGRAFARTINLIPWAIPTIVAGYVFRWLLDDQFGLIVSWVHSLTGIQMLVFIQPLAAKITVVLVQVWKDAPFLAVVFLAGMQGIPLDLYEAAKVDGANSWQRFWGVTVPLILPLVVTMAVFRIIWSLSGFDLVYGLTQGGPGVATSVLALQVFQKGILFFKFGLASAISVVLLILVGLIGVIALWVYRRVDVTL